MDPGQAGGRPVPVRLGDRQPHRPFGRGGGKEVQHRHRVPPVEVGGLGDIAHQGPGPVGNLAVGQPDGRPPGGGKGDFSLIAHLAQNTAEKGGLARPVGADEGHNLSAVEMEGHFLQDGVPLQLNGQALQLQAAGAGAPGGQLAVLDLSHPLGTVPSPQNPLIILRTSQRSWP